MRNQTSFRLTTTLLPGNMTAKTTTVINKLDSNGEKFYPSFTEETVVITNDDRTVMETTRAVCTDGVLTFIKRGLSDDGSQTQVPNRKLQWNPGSLCFITIGAGDIIDTGDDLYWNGDQTYEGAATFNGLLTTNKGVKYPSFPSLEDLQAYSDPFPGMFAVLDSDGELYRYNGLTEQWDVVTTSTPAQPPKASTTAIGTVRVATDEEFEAGTDTGLNGEYLIAPPSKILSAQKIVVIKLIDMSDTQGAKDILDAYLAGNTPIIEYYGDDPQQRVKDYYFISQAVPGYIYFYGIGLSTGSDATGAYIKWDYISLSYSGTTVSNISHVVKKAYVNSIA